MILYCLGADLKNLLNLLGVLAFGNELENFMLEERQLFGAKCFVISNSSPNSS